jgi:small subunit ribosomal protein S4
MGDPRRLKPKYEPPKKLWSKERIEEEKKLVEEYGLRSMHELWVMQKELKRVRREARKYLSAGEKGKAVGGIMISKCLRLGYAKEGVTLEGLLALGIRDILERRLETRVVKRGLAKSMRQSRQLIAHGFIAVKGRKMSSPSYIVPVSEEGTITYFKPINLEAPVMAQRTARKEEAGTPEEAAPAAVEAAAEEKPAEAAS